jgi:OFA family oxalate/formate antiporter-like MFS transporter
VGEIGDEPKGLAARVPFFYGWVMLPVTMLVLMATTPGQTFGVSTFNPYLLREFGFSQSELSGAYMLGTLLASIPMIYIGALMDRYGARRTLAGVVTLFGLACMGMSQTSGLVTVFVGFLFLRMLGQGAMSFLGGNSLAMWFNRKLGFTSGIMNLGEAFAVGFFPAANLMMIHSFGWRSAYAALGVAVWVLILPLLALVFRNRPEDIGQVVDGGVEPQTETDASEAELYRDHTLREAVRTRQYWIMAVATALPSMIITGIHFHTVQIYLDHGMLESDAAAMFATYALSFSIIMLIGGVLADRVPLNLLLAASLACLSGGIVLLMQVTDTWTSNLFAIVAGGGQGLFSAVSATIWVRYYGRTHLGKIRGGLTTVGVAASSAGPFVMGAGHDFFGGYDEVFWVFLVVTVPMVGIALLATRPEREKK